MSANTFADPALGDHVCLPVASDAEKLSFICDFAVNGVRSGHRVMVLTESAGVADASEKLARLIETSQPGQVIVMACRDAMLTDGVFDPDQALRGFEAARDSAIQDGYRGVWVVGDLGWAAEPDIPGIGRLFDFEAASNQLFIDGSLAAVCMYDRRLFESDAIDRATAAHPVTPAQAELRFAHTHDPAGVRVVGEVDATNRIPFRTVLRPLLAEDDDVVIDASALAFADAEALRLLGHTAEIRVGRTTLIAATPIIRMLRMSGADRIERLGFEEVSWTEVVPAPVPDTELPFETAFTGFRLTSVRRAVTAHAMGAGLDGAALEGFVFAVNELTTNAVRHGGGGGQIRLWSGDDYLYAEVVDKGQGVPPEYLEFTSIPKSFTHPGRGLWFARNLSESLDVDTAPEGTTVWLSVPIG